MAKKKEKARRKNAGGYFIPTLLVNDIKKILRDIGKKGRIKEK